MQRYLRHIIPTPLLTLDRKLLLHAPDIWATKIHYVLAFSGVALLLSSLFAMLVPMSAREVMHPDVGMGILFIPMGIVLILWIWQITRFPHWKQQGKRRKMHDSIQVFLFILGMTALVIVPFSYAGILNNRIANLVPDAQLIKDMEHLKAADTFIEDERGYQFGSTYNPRSVREIISLDCRDCHPYQVIHWPSEDYDWKTPDFQNASEAEAIYFKIGRQYSLKNIPTGKFSDRRYINSFKIDVKRNIYKIQLAKGRQFLFMNLEFLAWIFLIFPVLLFIIDWFKHSRWQTVAMTLVATAGIAFAELFVLVLLAFAGGGPAGLSLFWMAIIVNMSVFAITAFNPEQNSPRKVTWKSICVVLLMINIFLFPVATTVIAQASEMWPYWFALMAGEVMAMCFWHFSGRKRIIELQMVPRT